MNHITKALSWEISSKLFSQIIALGTTMILSRILTPEDFGLSAIIFAVSSLLYGFVNFGFSSALIQRKDVRNIHVSSVQWLNIILGIIFASLFFAISPQVVKWYDKPNLLIPIQIFSLSFLFGSLSMARIAMMERLMKFQALFWVFLISTIISNAIGIILALNEFGVLSLVIMHISNELMRALVVRMFYRYRYGYNLSFSVLKDLMGFSIKIMASGSLNSIYNRADMLIMGGYFSATSIGNYYRAKSLRVLVIRFVVDSLGKVLYSSFSRESHSDTDRKDILNRWLVPTNLVALLIAVFFASFAKEIVAILFGSQWYDTHRYFALFSLGIMLMPIHTLLVTYLNSQGDADFALRLSLGEKIALTLSLVLAVWLESLEIYIILDSLVRLVVVFYAIYFGNEFRRLDMSKVVRQFLVLLFFSIVSLCSSLIGLELATRALIAMSIVVFVSVRYKLVFNIKSIIHE